MPGELTDRGRETSLAFGKWLRRLYIDQLSLVNNVPLSMTLPRK